MTSQPTYPSSSLSAEDGLRFIAARPLPLFPAPFVLTPDTILAITVRSVWRTNRSSSSSGSGYLPPPLSCSSHSLFWIAVFARDLLRSYAARTGMINGLNNSVGSSGAHGSTAESSRAISRSSSSMLAMSIGRPFHPGTISGPPPSPPFLAPSGHSHIHHRLPSVTTPRQFSPPSREPCAASESIYREIWSRALSSLPVFPDPVPGAVGPPPALPAPPLSRSGLLTSMMHRKCLRCTSIGPDLVLYWSW